MIKKTYSGEKNSKERSTLILVEAVGTIIRTNGYTELNTFNIDKTAGVSLNGVQFKTGGKLDLTGNYSDL